MKFYPEVKSQTNLSSLRVSCERALSQTLASIAQKAKTKKQKKDRKQTEKQNYLALGDLVRSSNKVFIESNSFRLWLASFSAPKLAHMMEWLRDKVMRQRLRKL